MDNVILTPQRRDKVNPGSSKEHFTEQKNLFHLLFKMLRNMGEIVSSLACRRFISHHGTVNVQASYYQARAREKGNCLQLTSTPEVE